MKAPKPDPPTPLTVEELTALRALVATLRVHEGPWGYPRGGEKTGPKTVSMPWWEWHEDTRQASTWLYDTGRIVIFDWGTWDEGRETYRTWTDETPRSLDHLTVRKLLTAVNRNDRFCEGVWVGLFESGMAVALFERLVDRGRTTASEQSAPQV